MEVPIAVRERVEAERRSLSHSCILLNSRSLTLTCFRLIFLCLCENSSFFKEIESYEAIYPERLQDVKQKMAEKRKICADMGTCGGGGGTV